jgi:hypothetical protein
MCEAAFGNTRGCKEFASSNEGLFDDANQLDVHRKAICAQRTKGTAKYVFCVEYGRELSTDGCFQCETRKSGGSVNKIVRSVAIALERS